MMMGERERSDLFSSSFVQSITESKEEEEALITMLRRPSLYLPSTTTPVVQGNMELIILQIEIQSTVGLQIKKWRAELKAVKVSRIRLSEGGGSAT